MRKIAPIVRFAKMVDVGERDDCWPWLGCTNGHKPHEYGRFVLNRRNTTATRFLWTYLYGAIPERYEIDHLCKNPICVNPHHLEAVPRAENNRRSNSPSGLNARKTHCPRGHEFAVVGSVNYKNGRRHCLLCNRIQSREGQRRLRARRKCQASI